MNAQEIMTALTSHWPNLPLIHSALSTGEQILVCLAETPNINAAVVSFLGMEGRWCCTGMTLLRLPKPVETPEECVVAARIIIRECIRRLLEAK